MSNHVLSNAAIASSIMLGALCACAGGAEAGTGYLQTDLASDIPGLATLTDPNLVNTWGISHLPGSPFWTSNQGTNTASLFAVTGSTGVSAVPFSVAIPTFGTGGQGPTGQVANPGTSFDIKSGKNVVAPALFIFANLNGTISAWNLNNGTTGSTATVEAVTPGASFTGLAISSGDNTLYAANAATGAIDVFNGSFQQESLAAGAFTDPNLSPGLVPFNVQDIGANVYVTYALAGHAAQTTAALGQGAVAVFSETGTLEKTLIDGSQLASPWGLALAPTDFGKFGGDLLVGNFSFDHSEINAFNPVTGAFEGTIAVNPGMGNSAGGLWGLTFGGGGSGSPNTLYFLDGINGEHNGLFGAIASVPEPSTWAMMLAGFAFLGYAGYRGRRSAVAAAL